MTELVFIQQPASWCSWVIYPFLLVGDPPEKHSDLDLFIVSLEDMDLRRDEDLIDKVHKILLLVRMKQLPHSELREIFGLEKKVYLYDSDPSRVKIFLLCFIQRWFRWDLEQATGYVNSCLSFLSVIPRLTAGQIAQVKRYKRPLTVLICGERNSSICFEEMINFELKMLPKYSVIIHGGCKGVDLYAAELAGIHGFETKEYPADWALFGKSAGPTRNQEMLDSEQVDLVLAFHPDISISKGTKNMMSLAYKAGIPVYIHDLKRKMKFEGDFDVL